MVTSTQPTAGKERRKVVAAPRNGPGPSDVLLLTAQKLFAEKGIDAVSMREIARESGQRNNSALHYHFGSKEALIQAILQRGMVKIDELRNDYLDRMLEQQRHTEVRALVEAMVWPLATGLATKQMNSYNRFVAAAQMHPEIDLAASTRADGERGFRRIQEWLEPLLPQVPALVQRQRFLAAVAFVIFSLSDFERLKALRGKTNRGFDLQRAIDNLIDMLCGAMTAPVSAQVAQRLAAHDAPPPMPPVAKAAKTPQKRSA